jgi:hypothetical protein
VRTLSRKILERRAAARAGPAMPRENGRMAKLNVNGNLVDVDAD